MKTMNKEQTQGQMGKSWHSWRVDLQEATQDQALQMTSRWPAQESLQPGVALQVTAAANRLAFRFGERSCSS